MTSRRRDALVVVGAAVVLAVAALVGAARAAAAPPWLTPRLGGDTTAKALRGRPFNQSARNLDNAGLRRFAAGAEVFDRRLTPAQGLGPSFNANSCLACHRDGTQRDRVVDEAPGLLVRVSDAAGQPLPTFGLQLQTRSVGGAPEASVTVGWEGSDLRRPRVEVRPPLPKGAAVSARMAPPIVGLGLLEAIAAADLRAAADPGDANGDGISGRVAELPDGSIGRFGWKAAQPSVESQTLAALHEDLGVTAGELDPEELADMVFYNRTIAVPIARGTDSRAVRRGATLFEKTGCAACHTPTQRSGDDPTTALANETFQPFTDLLLHDMGPGLADGRPEGAATGREWRTPPLWGLSRRVEVTRRRAYLHDGRARTPDEAIRWHGGEADAAKRRYLALTVADRRALLAFLGAL